MAIRPSTCPRPGKVRFLARPESSAEHRSRGTSILDVFGRMATPRETHSVQSEEGVAEETFGNAVHKEAVPSLDVAEALWWLAVSTSRQHLGIDLASSPRYAEKCTLLRGNACPVSNSAFFFIPVICCLREVDGSLNRGKYTPQTTSGRPSCLPCSSCDADFYHSTYVRDGLLPVKELELPRARGMQQFLADAPPTASLERLRACRRRHGPDQNRHATTRERNRYTPGYARGCAKKIVQVVSVSAASPRCRRQPSAGFFPPAVERKHLPGGATKMGRTTCREEQRIGLRRLATPSAVIRYGATGWFLMTAKQQK